MTISSARIKVDCEKNAKQTAINVDMTLAAFSCLPLAFGSKIDRQLKLLLETTPIDNG